MSDSVEHSKDPTSLEYHNVMPIMMNYFCLQQGPIQFDANGTRIQNIIYHKEYQYCGEERPHKVADLYFLPI